MSPLKLSSLYLTNALILLGTSSCFSTKELPPQQEALTLSVAYNSSCALVKDGTVRCWGAHSAHSIGNTKGISSSVPEQLNLPNDKELVLASLGDRHHYALFADGTISAWGENESGKLGDGTDVDSNTLVNVALAPKDKAIQVSLGGRSGCALLEGGSVKCWGSNMGGQLGIKPNVDQALAYSLSPITVSFPSNAKVTQISAVGYHGCALFEDGTVMCWGDNQYGQLGDPTIALTASDTVTVALPKDEKATQIALGMAHACAILESGSTMCWGRNDDGQLGNGIRKNSATPVAVLSL